MTLNLHHVAVLKYAHITIFESMKQFRLPEISSKIYAKLSCLIHVIHYEVIINFVKICIITRAIDKSDEHK